MFYLITHNPIPYILAVLIGLATAWWIWGRVTTSAKDSHAAKHDHKSAPKPSPAPTPAPAPVSKSTGAAAAATAGAAGAGAAAASSSGSDGDSTAKKKPRIAAAVGEPDDLTRIKGIGPKLQKLCYSLGVKRFDQISAWTPADVAEVDQHLDSFKGRIERDQWVDQAKLLAAGDDAGHEKKYGK